MVEHGMHGYKPTRCSCLPSPDARAVIDHCPCGLSILFCGTGSMSSAEGGSSSHLRSR